MSGNYKWIFSLATGIILGILFQYYNVRPTNLLSVLVNLALLMAFGYTNTFFHELGHVLMGKIVGIPTRRIQIGTGREIIKFKFCDIDIELTSNLRGGFTVPYDYGNENIKSKFFLFSAGGVLLQGLIILPIIVLGPWHPASIINSETPDVIGAFVWANILGICLNLIPFRIVYYGLKIPNDGRRLLMTPFLSKKDFNEMLASAIANDGACYMYSKHYEQAEQSFREAIQKYPDAPLVVINLSAALIKMGRFGEAVQALEELRLTDYNQKCQALLCNNLAWAYLLKHDENSLDQADKLSDVSFQKQPDVPYFRGTRGCVLIAKGRAKEGLSVLEKLLKLNKRIDERINPPTSYLFAAYGYWLLGEKEMSNRFLQKLKQYKGVCDADYVRLNKILMVKTDGFVDANGLEK